MSVVRFEVDRGMGWETRSEGPVVVLAPGVLLRSLRFMTIQYPHRVFVDGKLIASSEPVPGYPHAPKITRHDASS